MNCFVRNITTWSRVSLRDLFVLHLDQGLPYSGSIYRAMTPSLKLEGQGLVRVTPRVLTEAAM